jgi:hypothetical protein
MDALPPPFEPVALPDGTIQRLERRLGRTVVDRRDARGGYTVARRLVLRLSDGSTVFAKVATNEETARALRAERVVYEAVRGPFLPRLLGFDDDGGSNPILVLEDLSAAQWPPPWGRGAVEAARDALAVIAATPAPASLPSLEAEGPLMRGWPRVDADPAPFLSLRLASRAWLDRALPVLRAGAERVVLGGEALVHADVRSDNLCFVDGRAVLVDWNWASRGNPRVDVAFWLPSLAYEGGPPPEAVLPRSGDEAALVSGYFASQAGLPPPTPSMVRVRGLQRAQLATALPWAARTNGLPPPDGAPV